MGERDRDVSRVIEMVDLLPPPYLFSPFLSLSLLGRFEV